MKRLPLWRTPAPPPAPPFADAIVQLAAFATGDGPSALALARVALHHAPTPAAAVAGLDSLLPAYWLSWPSVGPREWLELDLRASDAERLVSVLGEWSPRDRLLLGTWLLFDLPADELEHWITFPEAAARIMMLLRHVAGTLGWTERVNRPARCMEFIDSLLDAEDGQAGRETRLHLLGCWDCIDERSALQNARQMILRAWHLMFRAPHFDGQTTPYTREQSERRSWIMRRSVTFGALLVIGFAATRISAKTPLPAPVVAAVTAQGVVDAALHRWQQAGIAGILHERFRVLSGADTLVIERWYDSSAPHRLRVTVRTITGAARLDLITDGTRELSYTIAAPPFSGRTVSVTAPAVAQLLPLLRQLPVVGPLGSFPGDMRNADLALLWAAQRSQPRLLGSSVVEGRTVTHILFRSSDHEMTHLLVDEQTAALVRATRLDSNTGQNLVVWDTDVLETLANAAQLYDTADHYEPGVPDPRALLAPPPSDVAITTLLQREMPVAFPSALPAPVLGAFLHDQAGPSLPVAQIYEGDDWSLILNTSRRESLHSATPRFDRQVGDVAYTVVPHEANDLIHVEWQWRTNVRGSLLFWQAGRTTEQQLERVQSILASFTILTAANAAQIQQRFLLPSAPPAGRPSTAPGAY